MEYLFVVTYGRSGSTALQNVLNAIDGFCIRGENMGVLTNLSSAAASARKAVEQRGRFALGADRPWFGIDCADDAGFEKALAKAFVENILVPPSDARVTGFKEIRYAPVSLSDDSFDEAITFMMSAFGEARIIFNTRDWRQVARSGWWRKQRKANVRRNIVACDQRFRRAHARYPDRTFMIDHAQYDGNPEGFKPLLTWLGETLDAERLAAVGGQRLLHMKNRRNSVLIQRLKSSRLGHYLRRFLQDRRIA